MMVWKRFVLATMVIVGGQCYFLWGVNMYKTAGTPNCLFVIYWSCSLVDVYCFEIRMAT